MTESYDTSPFHVDSTSENILEYIPNLSDIKSIADDTNRTLLHNDYTTRNNIDLNSNKINFITDVPYTRNNSIYNILEFYQTTNDDLDTRSKLPEICLNSSTINSIEDEMESISSFILEPDYKLEIAKVNVDTVLVKDSTERFVRSILDSLVERSICNVAIKAPSKTRFLQVITEEDSEDEHKTVKTRRCSSLKLRRSFGENSVSKKIVRFADALGLDLTDIRTYLDEVPQVPQSAFQDLLDRYKSSHNQRGLSGRTTVILTPLFQQPDRIGDLFERLTVDKVCLENALVSGKHIKGTVLVENLTFEKTVQIRVTRDCWKSYKDVDCRYMESVDDEAVSDRFSFEFICNDDDESDDDDGRKVDDGIGDVKKVEKNVIGKKIEFAVRFQSRDEEYWDNNNEMNYGFEYLAVLEDDPCGDFGQEMSDECCAAFFYDQGSLLTKTEQQQQDTLEEYITKLMEQKSQKAKLDRELSSPVTNRLNNMCTMDALTLSGIVVLCMVFFYIQKAIYFV